MSRLIEGLQQRFRKAEGALALRDNLKGLPTEMIEDESRREEFESEFERLVVRCGEGAMVNLFTLYLVEQELEKEGSPERPINITMHQNTAEIFLRLAEKGWANVSITEKPTPIYAVMENESEMAVVKHGMLATSVFRGKKDNKHLRAIAERQNTSSQNAILLEPEEIREVFARIDAQE